MMPPKNDTNNCPQLDIFLVEVALDTKRLVTVGDIAFSYLFKILVRRE